MIIVATVDEAANEIEAEVICNEFDNTGSILISLIGVLPGPVPVFDYIGREL